MAPPPAVFREFGVSAITMAKNEEDWADVSVLSVLDFVDEVLVADHGSRDSTSEVLRALAGEHPGKVRLVDVSDRDFPSAINYMISLTRFRWILRWHADFVARTSGPSSIARLVENVRLLDPLRHFCIALSGVVLDGDLEHQFPDRRDPPEPFLYTYSPWLRYGVLRGFESLHVPWFYEKQTWPEGYYFHMRSVKSAMRVLQKRFWAEWCNQGKQGRPVSLETFIAQRAMQEFGGASVEEAAERHVVVYFQDLLPFSRELCGDYPEPLRPFLSLPPYRLVFENGTIVGRVETPRARRVRSPSR